MQLVRLMRIQECHQREVHRIAHIVLRNKCHSRKLKKLTRLRMTTSLWRMYIRRRNILFFWHEKDVDSISHGIDNKAVSSSQTCT